jgi:demethylmenaquinone methyltransferase/2-methoxy-6-polyprenyl-1,4-benzoquinol methylase
MAVCLYGLMPKGTSIKAVDFSPDMLAEARKKPEAKFIEFVTADTSALPFPGEHFDLITMSFATRNINLNRETLVRSFAEFYRVVKPGGRFVNLETSQPSNSIIRNCFHLYVKLIVKRVGYKMSGSRRGYAYLAATIPRFYSTEELADIMREAGFEKVTFKRLLFGVAAIHHATKLGD